MGKGDGGELSGKVCACGLSMSDGKCPFGNLCADGNSMIVNPINNGRATTSPFGRKMSSCSDIHGSDKTATGIDCPTRRAGGTPS